MKQQLAELIRLASGASRRGYATGIPRVSIVEGEVPEHALSAVYEPMVNLILRGSKSLAIGPHRLAYDPATYFVMTVDLPAVGVVRPASDGAPYLSAALTLDPQLVAQIASEALSLDHSPAGGFSVSTVTPELLDAWLRMLQLMQRPEEVAGLAPAYEREIVYRVLQGPQGWILRSLATADAVPARVQCAIRWIRGNLAAPLRVEELAARAAMSPSAFHRHFKAVTAMSPLQFQKRIRLLQARTSLVAGAASIASAAFDVGYESASQFSREYARFFGWTPSADRARLRKEARRLRVEGTGPG
ncbi:AraC family transcriptional regulator [Sphingomonas oligophenolica]|uniref:AraC family transcriptional regulator n=1 Tax=Sphingomonas oligophenolica TaxID=301154 RepID=A0ABU9Y0F1_9SPHN